MFLQGVGYGYTGTRSVPRGTQSDAGCRWKLGGLKQTLPWAFRGSLVLPTHDLGCLTPRLQENPFLQAYTQLRNTQIPGLDAPLGMQEKTSQGSLFYSSLLVTEFSWNKLV